MNTSKHTPGTIHCGAGNGHGSIFTDTEGERRCMGGLSPLFIVNGDNEEDQANAARLVAAWNACDGIPTDYLEGMGAGTFKRSQGFYRELLDLLSEAESFISGFEDDPGQEGIADLLDRISEKTDPAGTAQRRADMAQALGMPNIAGRILDGTASDLDLSGLEAARLAKETRDPAEIRDRLEELRSILRAECMSYGELHELQCLAEHIDPADVELLEAAGVPEGVSPTEHAATVRRETADAQAACAERADGEDILSFLEYEDARNEATRDATEAAINAGAKIVQSRLGQTAGDFASHFFDDAATAGVAGLFGRYFDAEALNMKPADSEPGAARLADEALDRRTGFRHVNRQATERNGREQDYTPAPNNRTEHRMPADLAPHGYRLEFGGPEAGRDDDGDSLVGRYWWTLCRDWPEAEASSGDWDTPEEAIGDAREHCERELARGADAFKS